MLGSRPSKRRNKNGAAREVSWSSLRLSFPSSRSRASSFSWPRLPRTRRSAICYINIASLPVCHPSRHATLPRCPVVPSRHPPTSAPPPPALNLFRPISRSSRASAPSRKLIYITNPLATKMGVGATCFKPTASACPTRRERTAIGTSPKSVNRHCAIRGAKIAPPTKQQGRATGKKATLRHAGRLPKKW